jgi:hypothetical protein
MNCDIPVIDGKCGVFPAKALSLSRDARCKRLLAYYFIILCHDITKLQEMNARMLFL